MPIALCFALYLYLIAGACTSRLLTCDEASVTIRPYIDLLETNEATGVTGERDVQARRVPHPPVREVVGGRSVTSAHAIADLI